MNDLIIVKPEKCVGCNSCVRICPAPEANIVRQLDDGRFITSVNPDRCIGCGECVTSCQHEARDYIDDVEECMSHIANEKMIILVSPAIKAILPDKWKSVLDWFRIQGCTIYDVSFGADICTWAHIRAIEQEKVGNVISQQCPAVVKYVETYQPKLLQHLSPIHSPSGCAAVYIKKYLRRNNPIAVLSPCIAKKLEFVDTGLIDYNITINKLFEFFKRNGVDISVDSDDSIDYKFDEQQGQLGSIYSRPGGLRDNLWTHLPELHIASSEGVRRIYPELEMYGKMSETKRPNVFDVLSCEFGCNVGPASASTQSVFDVLATMRKVETEAKARRKSGTGLLGRGEDKLFKRFDEELRLSDFLRSYKPSNPTPIPSVRQLEPVFEKMGMANPADRYFNCGACGFDTCRDMATAIYRGLNTPDNCIVHAKSVLTARHTALTIQNEKLEEITNKCFDISENLKKNVKEIADSVDAIDKSTTATSERAAVVKDLLENVVTFCSDNPTMDSDSVEQLISILNMTIDAFSALDGNVSTTNESSDVITRSVADITELVENINKILDEASKETERKENDK